MKFRNFGKNYPLKWFKMQWLSVRTLYKELLKQGKVTLEKNLVIKKLPIDFTILSNSHLPVSFDSMTYRIIRGFNCSRRKKRCSTKEWWRFWYPSNDRLQTKRETFLNEGKFSEQLASINELNSSRKVSDALTAGIVNEGCLHFVSRGKTHRQTDGKNVN